MSALGSSGPLVFICVILYANCEQMLDIYIKIFFSKMLQMHRCCMSSIWSFYCNDFH